MSHPLQSVLLFYPDAHVVERLVSLLDDGGFSATIVPVVDAKTAGELLSSSEWALIFLPLFDESFDALLQLHAPGAVIALANDAEDAIAMQALRAGAVNIFFVDHLVQLQEAKAFISAVSLHLSLSVSLQEKESYRRQLELSLAELRADQKAALHIQKNMLPPLESRLISDISISYCLDPSLYLSGDFIDYVTLNSRFAMFYLADVSGHGASSALVTVLLKNIANRLERNFRRGSSFDILSPELILRRINGELLETGLGKHLTMFVGVLDIEEGSLRYAVGGHYPMPVMCAESGSYLLEGRGMPVGLFEQPVFDVKEIPLPSSFSLAICSDGVFEMMPAGTLAEKELLFCNVVSGLSAPRAELLREALIPDGVDGAPDDIAIMLLERR